jgi:hypothetical protein
LPNRSQLTYAFFFATVHPPLFSFCHLINIHVTWQDTEFAVNFRHLRLYPWLKKTGSFFNFIHFSHSIIGWTGRNPLYMYSQNIHIFT